MLKWQTYVETTLAEKTAQCSQLLADQECEQEALMARNKVLQAELETYQGGQGALTLLVVEDLLISWEIFVVLQFFGINGFPFEKCFLDPQLMHYKVGIIFSKTRISKRIILTGRESCTVTRL